MGKTSAQIIHHTGIHVVDRYLLEDTLIRFQVKEDEMNAKKLTCDAMYMKKCATADAVIANIRDPEKINPEQLRKVFAPLELKQDKVIPITQHYLLISYCQWIHVEKRERRVIDGEEQNLNAGNFTDCADKLI